MYQIGSVEYGDELFHHGIKGMKWGVRRTPEQLGHKPPSEPKKKRVRISDAPDDLIKRRTARKKLENDYLSEVRRNEQLRKRGGENKSNHALGIAFVNNVIGKTIGVAGDLTKETISGIVQLGKTFISQAFSPKNTW